MITTAVRAFKPRANRTNGPVWSYWHIRAQINPQTPAVTSHARPRRQSTLKSSHLRGRCTQWISARATRPGQCPCFTRLFDRYQIGLIRRGFLEVGHFVAHAWAVGPTNVTTVDNPSQCGPCPIVVNRRFGMRLHRVAHGMYPAAGGGLPSIWARLMSPTRVLPRRNATIQYGLSIWLSPAPHF